MNKIIITAVAAAVTLGSLAQERGRMQANPEAKLEELKRTEARFESRKSAAGYPNVTFRVVREDK